MFLYKLLRKSWPFWKKQLVTSPEWLWVTTEKSYHSLPHWMVFTQICTLQIDAVQAECLCIFVQWKVWEIIQIGITYSYIGWTTGKKMSIDFTKIFFWNIILKFKLWVGMLGIQTSFMKCNCGPCKSSQARLSTLWLMIVILRYEKMIYYQAKESNGHLDWSALCTHQKHYFTFYIECMDEAKLTLYWRYGCTQ